jgi:hypothetical protein
MKEIYIFGTCRLCYPVHPAIRFVRSLREYHSRHYTINNDTMIYTEPVNYTTKLIDVLDSILYMTGNLYPDMDPTTNNTLKSIFFRGHITPIKPKTHPVSLSGIFFSKIIIEVSSIKQYIINTTKYGEEYYLKNLPWKITTWYEHNITFDEKDFIIKTMTKDECFETLDRIKNIVKCDILIIGPYVSKRVPDSVNQERIQTQNILKEYCDLNKVSYFDLSHDIEIAIPELERDETHFTEAGAKILSNVMYQFIMQN